jgi:serine/threonine protein kinase
MPGFEGQKLGRSGRYYLMHPLGRSTGEVYRAEDTLMRREVAVKVFTDDFLSPETFFRKCSDIGKLDHSAILPLLDYNTEEPAIGFFSPPVTIQKNICYLVMPYCKDGSLEDWLDKRGHAADSPFRPLSAQDTAYMVNQVAGALEYAHNRGFVHGNIKPSNLLIEWNSQNPERPKVLVADFPLRDYTPPRGKPPIYVALEQVTGRPVPASDQYALAIVAFQLLMGQWNVTPAIMPSTSNRSIPRAVDAVLARALVGSPSERFASILDFAAALSGASGLNEGLRNSSVPVQSPSSGPSPAQQISSPSPFYGTPGFPPPQEHPLYIQPGLTPLQEELSDDDSGWSPLSNQGRKHKSRPGLFKSVGDALSKFFYNTGEQPANAHHVSLFAIARAAVEEDDRAHVDKMYTVEAGIAQNKPQGFAGEAFTLPTQNPDEPVWFDILLHTSGNIEAVRVWHTRLRYDLRNPEPQLVPFYFRFIAPGTGTLSISFYHERRWLKTLHLTIETIEKPALSASEKRG